MPYDLTKFEALERAVEIAGGQAPTARLLGVSQGAVWKWVHKSKRIPAEHVIPMETATGVSRHLLRPDIYPLSLPTQGEDPGEDCGPILANCPASVAVDRKPEMKRTAGQ